MDAQDMILDDITRKQLIWYGHVDRMDPTRLPKIMIHWKPEEKNMYLYLSITTFAPPHDIIMNHTPCI